MDDFDRNELIEGEKGIGELCGGQGIAIPDPFNSGMSNEFTLHILCPEWIEQSTRDI